MYLLPPDDLQALVRAEEPPSIAVSPTRQHFLLFSSPSYLSLEQIAKDELRVAGLRFDPSLRMSSRVYWSSWAKICPLLGSQPEVCLQGPDRMRSFSFSKDGTALAFLGLVGSDELRVWVCTDLSTGVCSRTLPSMQPNSLLCAPFIWDFQGSLIVLCAPNDAQGAPRKPVVPQEPLIEESRGKATPARTYPDMLKTAYDEAVFEYYAASHVVCVDPRSTSATTLTQKPLLVAHFECSPDCNFLLLSTLIRPFSHKVPWNRFSKEYLVINLGDLGQSPVSFAVVPCQEDLSTSFDARPRGPRQVGFVWSLEHTLCFAQALDEGEPTLPAESRDALYYCSGPGFKLESALELARFEFRIDATAWTRQGDLLVTEAWFKTRQMRCWRHSPQNGGGKGQLLWDRSSEDVYSDPGEFRSSPLPQMGGRLAVREAAQGGLLLFGAGCAPGGSRPFVDVLQADGTRKRLWRSPQYLDSDSVDSGEAPCPSAMKNEYQRPIDLIGSWLLIMAESQTSPPNLFSLDLRNPDKLSPLTAFPHPQPALLGVKKELVRYTRADGVALNANLYVPADFVPGSSKPLPLLCWAYPAEFKSTSSAGQVKTSPHRFVRTQWHSPVLFAVSGYAVLDNFSAPIIGEGDTEPNDSFVVQLVMSAEAAVKEVVRRGVADPARVAVGGHSYGAFMVANLLTHAPGLFACGIARSGAYNRTLTPFSFQSEERTYWQASDTYHAISPFTHAHKLSAPILLIHGLDDTNPGTNVLQSERYYAALAGLGKNVRLCLLPHERHSYDALESCLHAVAEEYAWLDKHIGTGWSDNAAAARTVDKRPRI